MGRFLLVLLPLAALSCSQPSGFRGEDYDYYYRPENKEEQEERIDRKSIYTWGRDPKKKELIGYFETFKYKPKGSHQWRTYHLIMDARGLTQLGYVSELGRFYRQSRRARKTFIGEWKIHVTGLKVFFGLPLRVNLALEPIDPYGN